MFVNFNDDNNKKQNIKVIVLEIYFEEYFIPSVNQPHTLLNQPHLVIN